RRPTRLQKASVRTDLATYEAEERRGEGCGRHRRGLLPLLPGPAVGGATACAAERGNSESCPAAGCSLQRSAAGRSDGCTTTRSAATRGYGPAGFFIPGRLDLVAARGAE